jgi:DNA-binding response OmpR family regulator
MKDILIIEDNPAMLRGLEDNFELKGYRVKTAIDGEQGLSAALAEKPDLIILDLLLPKINGYEVCRLIRKKNSGVPIIMVTARDAESDIIQGLNCGADDYVTKPFSIRVLLARAQAFLRRSEDDGPAVYEFGDLQLDTIGRTVMRDSKEVTLTPGEFDMLRLFAVRAGCVLTREEILNAVWGHSHFVSLQDIDRFVTALRKKIELNPNEPEFICSVGDRGYRFEPPKPHGNSSNN